jgi:hypothetical protein
MSTAQETLALGDLDGPIAQPDESMFERNLGHLATRGKEVAIYVDVDFDLPIIGFLAGLDQEWIELASEDGRSWFLSRRKIVAIKTTGRVIDDIEEAGAKRVVRDQCHHFMKRMSYAFGSR